MNSIMRRTVRGAATGLGALALVAGASACGMLGGGEEGGDEPAVEQPAEDEGAEESSEEGSTEEGSGEEGSTEEGSGEEGSEGAEGGDTAGAPLSEEDLTAAADQAFAFFQAAISGDAETACGLMLDPTTDAPFTGGSLDSCVQGFSEQAKSEGIELDPSMADLIDRSMFAATDNGDGTAAITMAGEDIGLPMAKGEDGSWYVQGDALV